MQVVIQPLFSYFPTGNYRIFIILIIIRSYDFKHRKRIFFIEYLFHNQTSIWTFVFENIIRII